MSTVNDNLKDIDATDGDVTEDLFIGMVNERVVECDANPTSITSLYATALKDAGKAIEYQIGECNWETEVAPLLVKGIKELFKKRKEESNRPVENEQEDDYHEHDAIRNENVIELNEKLERRKQYKRLMANKQLKENQEPKRPRGRPRKGQEKEKDGEFVVEKTKAKAGLRRQTKPRANTKR